MSADPSGGSRVFRTDAADRLTRAPSEALITGRVVANDGRSMLGSLSNDHNTDALGKLFPLDRRAEQGTVSTGASHICTSRSTSRHPYHNIGFGQANIAGAGAGAGTPQVPYDGDGSLDSSFEPRPNLPSSRGTTAQGQPPYGLYPGPSSGHQLSASTNTLSDTNRQRPHTTPLFGNDAFASLPPLPARPPLHSPRNPFNTTQMGNTWRAQYAQTGQAGVGYATIAPPPNPPIPAATNAELLQHNSLVSSIQARNQSSSIRIAYEVTGTVNGRRFESAYPSEVRLSFHLLPELGDGNGYWNTPVIHDIRCGQTVTRFFPAGSVVRRLRKCANCYERGVECDHCFPCTTCVDNRIPHCRPHELLRPTRVVGVGSRDRAGRSGGRGGHVRDATGRGRGYGG